MDRPRIASGFLDGRTVYDSFRGEVIFCRNRMDQAGKSKKRRNLQAIAERSTDGFRALSQVVHSTPHRALVMEEHLPAC